MAAKWPLNWSVLACFLLNTCLAQLNNHPTKTNAVSIVLLYPFTSCDQLITEFPFASAFLVAVETINSSREFNFSLSIQWNDTRCSELVGIATMSEQWKRGVKAFIGPGNQSYCATSARIAASWNIPMISYVSDSIELNWRTINVIRVYQSQKSSRFDVKPNYIFPI